MSIQKAGTRIDYTVTFLEMTSRPGFGWPPQVSGPPASLLAADTPPPWYFLALYDAVGRDYLWTDMHHRNEADLAAWLSDPAVSLFTCMRSGWPHGFFLLDWREAGGCNLAYFGLVPQAVGTGLGSFLLRTAILTGWDRTGVTRMTVNTCTLDHPRALALYQRHGFAPVRQEQHTLVLTEDRDLTRIPD